MQAYTMNVFAAAEFLGYHHQTVRDLAREGKIPAIKRRHAWFFDRGELVLFLKAATKAHTETAPSRSTLKHELEDGSAQDEDDTQLSA